MKDVLGIVCVVGLVACLLTCIGMGIWATYMMPVEVEGPITRWQFSTLQWSQYPYYHWTQIGLLIVVLVCIAIGHKAIKGR